MSDPALGIAETTQSASIKRDARPSSPGRQHDIRFNSNNNNKKPPVVEPAPSEAASIPSDIIDPSRVIRPVARRPRLPPLPDLRFEQSYLASLTGAESWRRIAWITVRDQLLFPLIQGTLWTLALVGWRHWNQTARIGGNTLGVRIRRWWYQINNWELPLARDVRGDWRFGGKM